MACRLRQRIIPLCGSILQAETCQILNLVKIPRWSQVWQYFENKKKEKPNPEITGATKQTDLPKPIQPKLRQSKLNFVTNKPEFGKPPQKTALTNQKQPHKPTTIPRTRVETKTSMICAKKQNYNPELLISFLVNIIIN